MRDGRRLPTALFARVLNLLHLQGGAKRQWIMLFRRQFNSIKKTKVTYEIDSDHHVDQGWSSMSKCFFLTHSQLHTSLICS